MIVSLGTDKQELWTYCLLSMESVDLPAVARMSLSVLQKPLDDGLGYVWTATRADKCRDLVVKDSAVTHPKTRQEGR